MFKFGTVPFTHTDTTIKKYFKEMHNYMQQYNKTLVEDGIEAVLNGYASQNLFLYYIMYYEIFILNFF